MNANYKNCVLNGMICGFGIAAAGSTAVAGIVGKKPISALPGAGALGCGAWTAWFVYANKQFSDRRGTKAVRTRKILELAGFHVLSKWTEEESALYVRSFQFTITDTKQIGSTIAPLLYLAAKKRNGQKSK